MFLVLGVGKGRQHVGQRREGQIKAIHMVLAEDCHPDLGVARDGPLGGLQGSRDQPQQGRLSNACRIVQTVEIHPHQG